MELLLAHYGYAEALVPVRTFPLRQAIGGLAWPGLAWSQSLVLDGYWLRDSVRHPAGRTGEELADLAVLRPPGGVPEYCRGTPADRVRTFMKPVSSTVHLAREVHLATLRVVLDPQAVDAPSHVPGQRVVRRGAVGGEPLAAGTGISTP